MAMFNRNSLPEEFEAEHGSVDLADGDRKPLSGRGGAQQSPHDDREDEDLDLGRAGQRVWLCKVRCGPRLEVQRSEVAKAKGRFCQVPRFLLDKWQQSSREGEILGKVRVYDE